MQNISFCSMRWHWLNYVAVIGLAILSLTGCGGGGEADSPPPAATATPVAEAPAEEELEAAIIRLVPQEEGLTVQVENVTNLYAADIELAYDPTIVQLVDAAPDTEGIQVAAGEAPAPDFMVTNKVDPENGVILYVITQIAPREGFEGSGIIFTMNMEETEIPPSAVTITQVTLVSETGQEIPVTIEAITE